MEKITYPPFISHLQEHADEYNQLFRAHEIKFSSVDSTVITSWMVHVIEPIIKDVTSTAPEKLAQLSKVLFSELLPLLGNQTGLVFEKDYKAAWLLFRKMPSIVAIQPKRTVQAINSAIESLRAYQPEKVSDWIGLMDATVAHCQTVEEVLSVGRIYAWICGMAHLRNRAIDEINSLGKNLYDVVNEKSSIPLDAAIHSRWRNIQNPQFVAEVGGFVGYSGGCFTNPPMVALVGDEILVTDYKNTSALFIDNFGKVLLPDVPVAATVVVDHSSTDDFHSFSSTKFGYLAPFDDVTSCVAKGTTMVLTRSSSHYLFVYALSI